ncbi:hypothetical protein ADK34_34990 [Streptomyces viridochromogenes]|uniref:Endonuclease/exonuclease/phosphatase n=1 Tax=Streptomyces viridochromogenes TaxID=1938 RepID=A0A0L8JAJ3_STRVR|nr:hypothetical protein ADK34_34990 [Streptomyces viridochromogenes]
MRRLLAGLAAVAAALVGPTATVPPATAVGTTESGTFSVLTYNIAGLPESISSAPTPREPATTEIGRRIAPYDIVHVQEDFNHHARLYAADTAHPYRTPTVVQVQRVRAAEFSQQGGVQTWPDAGLGPVPKSAPGRDSGAAHGLGREIAPGDVGP